ncbi:MFS transporter [Actinomadura rubrisoli]|uniref:MFS transporter n=1 Tax=Actinomadura rubrisoli TaxID=2530368 RepID=A0A4R5BSH0_9ACTN|nr:MFS transporter [Actinomadura rubrisoli]TDD88526.1 MFS transporter [Actinomadura rubrisoli]
MNPTPSDTSNTSNTVSTADAPDIAARGRRATRGAAIGFAIDCYDIYLPVIALAPALHYFMDKDVASGTSALVNGLVFAATLLGRPLGAFIFGTIADTAGRRRATLIAMYGSAAGTLLLAFVPSFSAIGFASIGLLIVLRFATGVFLGGQYTGAIPLAMESSPVRKRGLYGGLITMGFPLAFCVMSLFTYLLLRVTGGTGGGNGGSAYEVWGWRIPVVVGALATFAFAVYYGRTVQESPAFLKVEVRKASPARQLVRGTAARSLRQVLILMTGVWILSNATSASFPVTLRSLDGVSSQRGTAIIVVAQVFLIAAYPLAGALSQRIGRRVVLALCGALGAVVAPLFYLAIVSGPVSSFAGLAALTTGLVLSSICCFGCTAAYISERFRTELRATGYGISYSFAIIIPAFYAFYERGLATFMDADHTTVVLYVVGGILLLIGALTGPETKDAVLVPAGGTAAKVVEDVK